MKPHLYPQAQCNKCGVLIGFAGQGPAYSSEEGGWNCKRHTSKTWKRAVDGAIKRQHGVHRKQGTAR